ncbi:uncharacterized protein LOC102806457 [Saccoglossus kowalevskii]|uniref:Branched-chain-amino-acid aminotransferase-like protein 1-like n=1 Tax=Saccoglossus kowalevskii TaxID=10224 RepID=A0ABM0LUG2_SACKO|nr:PREDICTED: branched-chain-amino-acid aminotransferase-like protein 1-like [Saccoglossus kowalevskii]
MSTSPVRHIAVWTHQRSMSTALLQWFAGRGDTKTFLEPFLVPLTNGIVNDPIINDVEYQDVKTMLESDYPGHNIVMFKEMAQYVSARYDKIPDGYTHTFLIRDPNQSIHSYWKIAERKPDPRFGLASLKPVFDLYQYVTQELKQTAVIIDAHELSHHPEVMLKTYCQSVNIPFREEMLSWKPAIIDGWHPNLTDYLDTNLWFGKALQSTSFEPLSENDYTHELSSIPEAGRDALEESRQVYKFLYERRLKPSVLLCEETDE